MQKRYSVFNFTFSFLIEEFDFTWRDLIAFLMFISFLWLAIDLIKDMNVPYTTSSFQDLNLNYDRIPYYMMRSTFRMFLAYGASLLFTTTFGYWAYRSKRARSLIIPMVDILQSVPVLGFLSITVTGFMSFFPHNLLGVELASLFAIFTGQVWNMTLGFYHSLITLPNDLQEVSKVYKLNPWQRFSRLELPNSTISLVWNSMMSFGGGWFFVVQSEMITVLGKNIKLPGIGSYMGMALEKGDSKAALYAVLAMVTTIVLIDLLFWKPITVWSMKFKNEQVDSAENPKSIIFEILNKSKLVNKLVDLILRSIDIFFNWFFSLGTVTFLKNKKKKKIIKDNRLFDFFFYIFVFGAITYIIYFAFHQIKNKFSLDDILLVLKLGTYTMLRVFLMVIVSTLIWTPIGVWVGFRPSAAKIVRPLAQIGASFPINMTFPIVVAFFINHSIDMNWGSIFLLSLGAQWYVLFNIIAGASSIPSDMKECARIFNLKGIKLWSKMIIPAIFPFWVTGACTAAGGAWNASIVAEYANFGKQKLIAQGLGSYISQATSEGNWSAIFLSIATMSIFVVLINRLVWRKLYKLSADKFHLE
ncbi:MAG: ABC transporter permease subunit [Bacteriovorax sp.]|nr:ABC transporter permease subunit [Bacteriovorax sp.]